MLKCILLVDDNHDCNFIHQRVIDKGKYAEKVEVALDGEEALNYLNGCRQGQFILPELILLDINMPRMNGWEFLAEYERLQPALEPAPLIFMLTSSLNSDDRENALRFSSVKGYLDKFLTTETLERILREYWPS